MQDPSRQCGHIRAKLGAHSVGCLSDTDRQQVARHIEICRDCARELQAIEATGALLGKVPLEPAPDRWEVIRANLQPRPGRARALWLRYRLQSAVGVLVAVTAIAAGLLIDERPPAEVEAQTLFADHASMSWREPFADKAALGMAPVAPIEDRTEDGR